MESETSLRMLVDQAVETAIQEQIIYTNELDAEAVNRITSALRAELSGAKDPERRQRDLEYVLHTYGVDMALQLGQDGISNDISADTQSTFAKILALIDISAVLSDSGVLDASLAFTLLEETMDMVDMTQAGSIFSHIERRAEFLRRGVSATGGKGVVMLRMCNGLLRRIPQSTMSEFAGRVQIFVANTFALSERSGVNLRGDTDTMHIAKPDETSDDPLYKSFWLLQKYFADPKMLQTGDSVKAFVDAATMTVDEFRRTINSRVPPISLDPTGKENLRHLTAQALFRMQLADTMVKCQVLLQILIFIKHVLALTGDALQKLRETATNKLVINEFVLTNTERASLMDIRKRAIHQLVGAANDRGLLSRTAQFILFHESNWFRWKSESCRPFEPQPLPEELVAEMQAAAKGFLAHGTVIFGTCSSKSTGKMMDSGPSLWDLPPVTVDDVEGLGGQVQNMDLLAAMKRLDVYCREDSDYELLTASEQARADLLQWRALRESVHEDVFRNVNPASHALTSLRTLVFPASAEDGATMEVE
ncbi:hypothetical protein H4R99_001133 [Coemansia sp. RSA 1722]|nr:hypothetical protein IWW45_001965 [Coemansia sp. RSA 485]KAJ2602707.1 hypothetical protein GGF39_000585 [Coemansia sp. RSA 1721]KAJ2605404.1 hypothetical protein H4R99_001133 [Coemansia sp. RSA 1722]KAJ2640241.1 hypothetical protein GGF40_000140 [Coemansia sp. RSA 1286]